MVCVCVCVSLSLSLCVCVCVCVCVSSRLSRKVLVCSILFVMDLCQSGCSYTPFFASGILGDKPNDGLLGVQSHVVDACKRVRHGHGLCLLVEDFDAFEAYCHQRLWNVCE